MTTSQVLQQYFGYTTFLEGQESLIARILSKQDVLGIMPTGAGKSLCFQVPAMVFEGITLVVSPLISLMKDQVQALAQNGVPAAYINSTLTRNQMGRVIYNAQNGQYKLIYVAPERLFTENFLRFAKNADISLLAIDEAHCVSHWGQNFRPSYLKIKDFIDRLTHRPVIAAFTATATREVKTDIQNMIELIDPFVLTTGFDRKNLFFEVKKPSDKYFALKNILEDRAQKYGVVYCSTRKIVEAVCENLCADGYLATRYHAGLTEIERARNQDDFLYDKKRVMVATNAFGMGIDKSNVSFVVHYNMPKSIESYYQEAGRAGRDGSPADCVLLYSAKDVVTNQFLISKSNDVSELDAQTREKLKLKSLERLKQMTFLCHTSECLRAYILAYFGDKAAAYCGNCGNCNTHFTEVDITQDAQKILSCVYHTGQRFGVKIITDMLRGSRSRRVIDLGLLSVKTHGIMAGISEKRIRDMINYLMLKKYLLQTNTEYPILKLTLAAREVLLDNKVLLMKMAKDSSEIDYKASKTKKSSRSKTYYETSKEGDDVIRNSYLFETLRETRMRLAREADVPAFVIFSDATLIDMCKTRPSNMAEFLAVKGVGVVKQKRYGKIFIDALSIAAQQTQV